jgi:hypothetical protein
MSCGSSLPWWVIAIIFAVAVYFSPWFDGEQE